MFPIRLWQFYWLASFNPTAFIIRLLFISVLLMGFVIFCSDKIAESLLPLYRDIFQLISSDFTILFIGLAKDGADHVIRLNVALPNAIAVAGHLVMPNPEAVATVSTLIGNIFHPLVVGLIFALTWPANSWKSVLLRLVVLLLLLFLETIVNVPLFLAGNLWGVFLDNLSPGSWSPMTAWADFLQGGGRYALGFVAALASIAVSDFAILSSKNIL
jgi:hypothetical protein